jgi:signal transduction histidine kinase
VDARDVDALRERLDRLCLEAAELRASRKRLVLAADADRRLIERDLHTGVQQHLVALAVNLQRVSGLVDADPMAANALLEEMGHDVQQALDETAQLAQRIYAPLLESSGLAAALRSAVTMAGISVSIEVAAGSDYTPEFAGRVYLCCLEALASAEAGARATLEVRDENGMVAIELVEDGAPSAAGIDRLRDRIEALGGRLTIRPEPGRGTRVSGSLPLARRR